MGIEWEELADDSRVQRESQKSCCVTTCLPDEVAEALRELLGHAAIYRRRKEEARSAVRKIPYVPALLYGK